jgi:hypothetical protein
MISAALRLLAGSFIWFVWFVLFVWLNETNQTNQMNQINQTNQLNQLKGGSRSSGDSEAEAPAALTLSQPGAWQPGGGSGWVLRRESSPLSAHA